MKIKFLQKLPKAFIVITGTVLLLPVQRARAQSAGDVKSALVKWVNQYTDFIVKVRDAKTESETIALYKSQSKDILDNYKAAMDIAEKYDKTHSAADEQKLRNELKNDPALIKWERIGDEYAQKVPPFKPGPELIKISMDFMKKIGDVAEHYHFKLRDDE